jgi:hypothetical protein
MADESKKIKKIDRGLQVVCLNDYNEDIPISYSIVVVKAKATLTPEQQNSADGKTDLEELVDLSILFNKYIKKIDVTQSVGELKKADIDFEYGVTEDSYFNGGADDPGEALPWSVFFGLNNRSIRYRIDYKTMKDIKYYVKMLPVNFTTAQQNKIKIINDFIIKLNNADRSQSRPRVSTTRAGSMGNSNSQNSVTKELVSSEIKELIRLLRKEDKELEGTINIFEYRLLKNEGALIKGVPIANAFKGSENGMIDFTVVLHEKYTSTDTTLDSQARSYIQDINLTSYKITNKNCFTLFINDAINGEKLTLANFMALLLGGNLDADLKFTPGVYKKKSTRQYILTTSGQNATPVITATNVNEVSNAKKLEELVKTNYLLNFTELASYDFSLGYLLGPEKDKPKRDKLLYYDPVTYGAMTTGIRNATGQLAGSPDIAQQNKINIFNAMLKKFDDFTTKVSSINATTADPFFQYLTYVEQFFLIKHNTSGQSKLENVMSFFFKQAPVASTSFVAKKVEDLTKIDDSILVMDYGGLVTSFQHSIKASPVKVSPVSADKANVSVALSGTTLDIELNRAAVERYGNELYKKTYNTSIIEHGQKYVEAIQQAIDKDPDEFLSNFIEFAVAESGSFKVPEETKGLPKKGGQHLLLNLKHPVPGLDMGSIIYFMAAGEEMQTPVNQFASMGTSNSERNPGYYVIPPKIRGIYYVNKVHNTFNNKSNLWVQKVECER